MSTRLRRVAALAVVPALALSLAACGSSDTAKGFDAVGIAGSFGQAPTFTFKKQMAAGDATTKTLIDGTGAALAQGDHVLVNFAVADTATDDTPITTFGKDTGAVGLQVGQAAPTQPRVLGDVFTSELINYVKVGTKVGSRIAVAGSVDKVFPTIWSELPSLRYNVGNEDGIVLVMDIVGVASAPSGTPQKSPSWAPRIVTKNNLPANLSFRGTPQPDGKLRVATLIKGSGQAVTADDTVGVQYLGSVYRGKKPFDESFSTQRYLYAQLGLNVDVNKAMQTSVIKGWTKGLVGVPVGSRVLVEIPPALGYGKTAQGTSIPANSTLYFVIDILGAA
ncbi:MAG TPA: FKBP-type peptidyl-prolyl cis-trans isomerase [Nocardioides sp.]|nr:FKBP-type peptidyl-prolyl cis-trans isomerase [Nocardioides sp.]